MISNLYNKLWFSIYPESCSSSLHVVITAYNSLKDKFNFIKYKLNFVFFSWIKYYFSLYKSKNLVSWNKCLITPLAFTHPKCTHTAMNTHTHTVNTHPEQWAAIYAAANGEQLGVRCLAQGTRVSHVYTQDMTTWKHAANEKHKMRATQHQDITWMHTANKNTNCMQKHKTQHTWTECAAEWTRDRTLTQRDRTWSASVRTPTRNRNSRHECRDLNTMLKHETRQADEREWDAHMKTEHNGSVTKPWITLDGSDRTLTKSVSLGLPFWLSLQCDITLRRARPWGWLTALSYYSFCPQRLRCPSFSPCWSTSNVNNVSQAIPMLCVCM